VSLAALLLNICCYYVIVATMAGTSMISSTANEQMSAVLYWFVHWTSAQRDSFLDDLVCKAVPNKILTIIEAMNSLGMNSSEQSMFHCQLRLFDNWFKGWSDDERNCFLQQLERIDILFVERLNNRVALTCGQM